MRRFRALLVKELLQVLRDPTVLFISFMLPPMLLWLFANAVSLDVEDVALGLVLESDSAQAVELAAAFAATPFLEVTPARHRREIERQLVSGELKGMVIIPADFDERMLDPGRAASIQIITDGSSPNSANFVASYAQGVFRDWLQGVAPELAQPAIELQPRFWFNAELESRGVLIPGAIAIVMTMIGTMLTALVVSREWERGTMEAVISTPASVIEIILSKLLPYFLLGGAAIIGCVFFAHEVYGVPLRGSPHALALVGSAFLLPALGQGLLISTLAKSQFVAVQAAIMSGFLPAVMLSGFVYPINNMPVILQWFTLLIPARHFVSSLQTVFLAGDIWPYLLANVAAMLGVAALFFSITFAKSGKSLG